MAAAVLKAILVETNGIFRSSKKLLAFIIAIGTIFGVPSVILSVLPAWVLPVAIVMVASCYLLAGYVKWRRLRVIPPASSSLGGGMAFFRYLRAFDENSREFFWGRERKVASTVDLVLASEFRVGIVVGPSGSGKTSLMKAGLIPRLKERHVQTHYCNLSTAATLDRFGAMFCLRTKTDEPRPVLILDQAEAVLRSPAPDVEAFLSAVSRTVTNNNSAVLLVVRDEAFAQLIRVLEESFPEVRRPNCQVDVPHFDKAGARRVMERALAGSEVEMPTDLLEAMLDDLCGTGSGLVVPAELQIVASSLCDVQDKPTAAMYQRLGGKAGIVRRFVEQRVLGTFEEADRPSAKNVLCALIEDGEPRCLDKDGVARESALPQSAADSILQRLVYAGVVEEHNGTYQLMHAYYIDGIERLAGAIAGGAARARRILRERLSVWRVDGRTRIPQEELRVVRRHWHSMALDDLREQADPLLRASIAATRRRAWVLYGCVAGALGLLVYIVVPLLRYQMLAHSSMGLLRIDLPVGSDLLEFSWIDPTTGARAPVAIIPGTTNELQQGLYYLRIRQPRSQTTYDRYPIVVSTLHHIDDVRLLTVRSEQLTTDLSNMVLVPGGAYAIGDDEGRDDEHPTHEVKLRPFYVDQFEVSNVQYSAFMKHMDATKDHSYCADIEPEGKDHHPTPWHGHQPASYLTDSVYGQYPVVNIDWYDAYSYCAWSRKRLPTEAEWEAAARRHTDRRYPWGDDPPADNSNCRANFVDSLGCAEMRGQGFTTRVDAFLRGATPEGVFNMAGNVYEYCYDWYHGSYYAKAIIDNPIGPGVQSDGKVVRGGSHDHPAEDLRNVNRQITWAPASCNWIGFRCVVTASDGQSEPLLADKSGGD